MVQKPASGRQKGTNSRIYLIACWEVKINHWTKERGLEKTA